ncbi:MAG: hypothetical protein ACXV7G_12960 [Halobacteriota archaeon]
MSEIALIWDRPLLFEKLFVEYRLACVRVSPLQIGTAYSPKFTVAILPVGFGNPAYSTVAKSVRNIGTPMQQFMRKGGVLIAFSPYVDDYDFTWLGLPCRVKHLVGDTPMKIEVRKQHPAAHILNVYEAYTDGYLIGVEENKVILQSEDGPVLIAKPVDRGLVILSTIHEFPARQFMTWVVDIAHQ